MGERQGLTLSRRHLLKGAIGGAAGLVLGASARLVSAAALQAVSGGSGAQRLADDLFIIESRAKRTSSRTRARAVCCSLMAARRRRLAR